MLLWHHDRMVILLAVAACRTLRGNLLESRRLNPDID
jgi:hypothetical protein